MIGIIQAKSVAFLESEALEVSLKEFAAEASSHAREMVYSHPSLQGPET